jgi:hypothetical protein
LVLHRDLWVTTAIDDLDGIPIGLRTICLEAFEVGLLHAVFSHEFIKFSLHNTLDLHASNCMSHMAMVMTLQYVASYM